jgi:hypothetical protein
MPIESVWIAALDKRKQMVLDLEPQVEKYLGLNLNTFWSGDGSHEEVPYDRIDFSRETAERYSNYGAGEGRARHGNAFLSHRQMFRKILVNNYCNNALILEEDIFFIEDRWNTIFHQKELQDLIDDQFVDAVYFGWQAKAYAGDSDDLNEVEEMWKQGHYYFPRVQHMYNNISGLHAILIKRRLLDKLARLDMGPVDSYLGQNIDRYNMYYVCPKIIGSLASYSNAEGRWQDRSILT